jgi:hypothetical protein
MQKLATGLKTVGTHQSRKCTKDIVRHPRRTAEDVASHHRVRRIAELEKEARKLIARSITLIARGREANIQLGRIFIKLKRLVGHGHFEKYYERKFGRFYGIAFRTAQDYMVLAREADEAKSADTALFPLAMDPQAVNIRKQTERARLAVADAESESPGESTTDPEAQATNPAPNSAGSMVTCRLFIRMMRGQRKRVTALLRSEHRALAESTVIDTLLKLCDEYRIAGSDSREASE